MRRFAARGCILQGLTCLRVIGFSLVYQLLSLSGVLILGQTPSQWPPLFEAPWAAPSLHEFWGKSWHQLLRQTFFIMGGKPLGALLGPNGLVLGTFLGSGLYHSWALYAMGMGTDWSCISFFVLQGVGMTLERVWRGVSGKRMDGWFGIAWVWVWTMGGGQICSKLTLRLSSVYDEFLSTLRPSYRQRLAHSRSIRARLYP